jgi:hypothetical protein
VRISNRPGKVFIFAFKMNFNIIKVKSLSSGE